MTKDPKNQLAVFHALESQSKKTLAAAIRQWMPQESWNSVKRMIVNRRVQVNGNLCVDDSRRLVVGDVVRVLPSGMAKPVDSTKLRVVYLDDDLVILDKPAGVTSVRHFEEREMHVKRRQRQPTLQELVPMAIARKLYEARHEDVSRRRKPRTDREIEELIESSARRYRVIAVHRLDRDTSGLVVFARTKTAALALGKMFRLHEVDRRYTAVVLGECKSQTLVSYMVRDRGDGKRGSVAIVDGKIPEDARRAVTHVRPLRIMHVGAQAYSIMECKLETGRTHQIRIHLSEAGHMICGEPIYNRTRTGKPILDSSGAPRQALHAGAIRFVHPINGEKIALKSPLPHEFQQWLERIESEGQQ
jgi:23S rRNA pseudouridine1911/1915/1917 synthase